MRAVRVLAGSESPRKATESSTFTTADTMRVIENTNQFEIGASNVDHSAAGGESRLCALLSLSLIALPVSPRS